MSDKMHLLLLSSSRTPGTPFLDHARDFLRGFLAGNARRVLFIPYATVSLSHEQMTARVAEVFASLGCECIGIHTEPDPVKAVESAEAVVVSGGNTFRLLQLLQQQRLLAPLRALARAGKPYVGWSAGSNVACPSIRTTNDMPIAWPADPEALGLVPFQINPHYTDAVPAGHQGETRDERLTEFMKLNPAMPVVGLREGSALRLSGGQLELLGGLPARLFHGGVMRDLAPGESLLSLLATPR